MTANPGQCDWETNRTTRRIVDLPRAGSGALEHLPHVLRILA